MNDEGGQATYHNLHGALDELRNVFGGAGKLEYHHEKDNETWRSEPGLPRRSSAFTISS